MTTPGAKETNGEDAVFFTIQLVLIPVALWWSWPRVVGARLWALPAISLWQAWAVFVFTWATKRLVLGIKDRNRP